MSRVLSFTARTILASLMISGLLFAAVAFAGSDVGSVNFVLGYKNLSGNRYLEADTGQDPGRVSQPGMGVELTWGRQIWPVQLALDVLHSYDDGIARVPASAYNLRLRASTLEVGLGVRRSWSIGSVTPHIGAGGSWVSGNSLIEVSDPNAGQFGTQTAGARARTSGTGCWAGAGLACRIGPRFQIGLAGRYSETIISSAAIILDNGELPFTDTRVPKQDGGKRHINLSVGWAFPGRK